MRQSGLALIAAEIGLRGLGRFDPPNSPPVPRYPGFYRPDPEIGYTLWPSRRTTYRYPVGSSNELVLVSNADGFRSAREFDSPDSRPRVWVLGDSMVLGDGVAAEDRLTEVIEQREPGWRVDNLGMSGYGVDLMIRACERLSKRVKPSRSGFLHGRLSPAASVQRRSGLSLSEVRAAERPARHRRRTWLRNWSQEAGVPFLDLTDTIHAAGSAAFIRGNAHWNERGHRLAGEAIRAFLRQTVLRN